MTNEEEQEQVHQQQEPGGQQESAHQGTTSWATGNPRTKTAECIRSMSRPARSCAGPLICQPVIPTQLHRIRGGGPGGGTSLIESISATLFWLLLLLLLLKCCCAALLGTAAQNPGNRASDIHM